MKYIKNLFSLGLKEQIFAIKDDFYYSILVWWKYFKETWPLFSILIILSMGAIYLADPAPPSEINFASGVKGGSYEKLVLEYQSYLAQYDVKVNIIPTAGPITNLELLSGDAKALAKYLPNVEPTDRRIDVALTQAGLASDIKNIDQIIYIGSIDYEPLLFMIRRSLLQNITSNEIKSFTELNVATGQIGTGTHAQLAKLMALDDAGTLDSNVQAMTDEQAVAALLADDIDGMVLVDGIESRNVQNVALSDQIEILNFTRAQAYRRRLPYLQVLTIPVGSLNLSKNIPSQDIKILSTTTALIAKADTHPAIQYLLARASTDIAGKATFFADSREFPQFNDPLIPHSEIAREYYLNGSPYLQRFFPFWLAEIFDRLFFIILPFSALAYPILLALPKYRGRRLARKIWANYDQLRTLELEMNDNFDHNKLDEYLNRLDKIEADAVNIKISGSMGDDYFIHLQHIHFVRSLMHRKAR
jgi:TRAP-type uncharacterized transport system substrate-binding protein